MSSFLPYDQRVEALTVSGYAFYGSDQSPPDSDRSMLPQIMTAYQNLWGVLNAQKNTCFIHIVDIFWQNSEIFQLSPNESEPIL